MCELLTNHARPVIAIDKSGYLHVVMSGHNSPVTYRRSVRPNDATAWTDSEPAGTGTYPVLTCGEDGTLYLTLRSSNRWNGVDLYVKSTDGPWRKSVKLIQRDPKLPGYAGFQNGLVWGPKHRTLHMVVDFYESVETYKQRGIHQAVCYMRSSDGGKTWQRADGTNVTLPARPEDMGTLAGSTKERHQKLPPPSILAQGGIVVDSNGAPPVFYVSHLNKPGQIIHATPDDNGKWRQAPIDAVAKNVSDRRPMACRGALTVDRDDVISILLELKPLGKLWLDGKPTRALSFATEGKSLIWLRSRDLGKTFDVQTASANDQTFNQANVERPAGFNVIPHGHCPAFVYFDGTSRYPKQGEILQNNVYLHLAGDDEHQPSKPVVLDARRIWDKAPHNAFTDLLRHKDRWYCVFREGKAHVSSDGALRVITSADGEKWESLALIESPKYDLRDAKITVTPKGHLMLNGAGMIADAKVRYHSMCWFSEDDGRTWDEGKQIGDPGFWLWRAHWHDSAVYSMGYSTERDRTTRKLRLYRSADGRKYETLVKQVSVPAGCGEDKILFLNDKSALCLLRHETGDKMAQLGTSQPPYTQWKWRALNVRIGGPNMIQIPDGCILVATRLYDGGTRTSLSWLDPEKATMTEVLRLPSGGDTSYPGMVWHDGVLWLSYYSSHEGKASIYLAKVRIPNQNSSTRRTIHLSTARPNCR